MEEGSFLTDKDIYSAVLGMILRKRNLAGVFRTGAVLILLSGRRTARL